ncbi:MAG: hypothetical protein M0T79_15015 [Actinomycetota bacterium]|nr:hypothetical protein [Actinomycetota bacterium]
MATRQALLERSHDNARPQPAPQPERAPRPDLGVLDRRHLAARAKRRQARLLQILAAGSVAGALLLVALGHAFVASEQVRADAIQSEVAQALLAQQDYQLQKAELMAPTRILAIAETRLHMVVPAGITYLSPVSTGETVAQAHRVSRGRTQKP